MLLVALMLSLGLLSVDTQTTPVAQASERMAQIHPESIHAEFHKEIVIVPCMLAGVSSLRCVLDTGSSMTGVSPKLVEQLKLHPVSEPGASSSSPLAYTLPSQKVQLGTNMLIVERMGMAPLDVVSKAVGERVDVLLGTSAFEQLQITIDPVLSEVRIAAPSTAVSGTAHSIQIIMPNHVPIGFATMKAAGDKGVIVPMHIDTVSMPTLLLNKPFWDAHPEIATGNRAVRDSDVLLTVDGMRFGGEFRNVPAIESLDTSVARSSRLVGGWIGAPVLNRFVITYDLGRSAMYTTPVSGFDRPFERPPAR